MFTVETILNRHHHRYIFFGKVSNKPIQCPIYGLSQRRFSADAKVHCFEGQLIWRHYWLKVVLWLNPGSSTTPYDFRHQSPWLAGMLRANVFESIEFCSGPCRALRPAFLIISPQLAHPK
jgi:hypothetical protein